MLKAEEQEPEKKKIERTLQYICNQANLWAIKLSETVTVKHFP